MSQGTAAGNLTSFGQLKYPSDLSEEHFFPEAIRFGFVQRTGVDFDDVTDAMTNTYKKELRTSRSSDFVTGGRHGLGTGDLQWGSESGLGDVTFSQATPADKAILDEKFRKYQETHGGEKPEPSLVETWINKIGAGWASTRTLRAGNGARPSTWCRTLRGPTSWRWPPLWRRPLRDGHCRKRGH